MEIKDIKVGESFTYNGHNYTKLKEDNLCLIDDYDEGFMRCIFDPMDNNFNESLIKFYINSDRFINRLNIDTSDVLSIDGDFLTLLSKEEYEECQEIIKGYETIWWLRSGNHNYSYNAYGVTCNGNLSDNRVTYSGGVRPALILKPGVVVELRRGK